MTDDAQNPPLDDDGNPPPWWHSAPSQPPVDSVFVEGLKLAGALRNWAVESGAVAAATEMAQNAAAGASALLAQAAEQHPEPDAEPETAAQVVRCTDCPICQGLDALERTNPEWAHTARAALSQINDLVAGLIGGTGGQSGQANS
ncbi:MAG: hypothetical protein U0R23_03480 [Candidatus Nanopelagicales bacterium]